MGIIHGPAAVSLLSAQNFFTCSHGEVPRLLLQQTSVFITGQCLPSREVPELAGDGCTVHFEGGFTFSVTSDVQLVSSPLILRAARAIQRS